MRIGDRLNYVWRLMGTGFAFVTFGFGGVVLALIVFPAINIFLIGRPGRRQRVAQRVIHLTWKHYVRLLAGLGVLTLEVRGGELLRTDRATIVVANHPSLLDVVLLMALIERAQCVVKEGVWRNPVMRGVVRAANYIPNGRDPGRLIADCQRALEQGNNLIIFPEASRTVPGRERRYQRGFAHLAVRTGAPVRIVAITCDPPTLLKGDRWYDIPARRARFVVRVEEKLELSKLNLDDMPSLAARQLTRHVAARHKEILGDGTTGIRAEASDSGGTVSGGRSAGTDRHGRALIWR